MNLAKRVAKLKYYLKNNFSLFQEIERNSYSYRNENNRHNSEFSELHFSLVESRAISLAIAGFTLSAYENGSNSEAEKEFYRVTCEYKNESKKTY